MGPTSPCLFEVLAQLSAVRPWARALARIGTLLTLLQFFRIRYTQSHNATFKYSYADTHTHSHPLTLARVFDPTSRPNGRFRHYSHAFDGNRVSSWPLDQHDRQRDPRMRGHLLLGARGKIEALRSDLVAALGGVCDGAMPAVVCHWPLPVRSFALRISRCVALRCTAVGCAALGCFALRGAFRASVHLC